MILQKDIVEVGKFLKTHALAGELNIVFDIDADFFAPGQALIVEMDGILVPFFIESIRPKGHFSSLIKLQGIKNIDDAKPFVNQPVYILREDLPEEELPDEEGMYADQLVGFEIHDTEGSLIGTISALDLSSDNPLFIVRSQSGKDIFIPAADDLIQEVDPDKNILVMDLPQGLVDLND